MKTETLDKLISTGFAKTEIELKDCVIYKRNEEYVIYNPQKDKVEASYCKR